jgi:hypothetical protein
VEVDAHSWDWVLWLGGKELRQRGDQVSTELRKLHAHLLGPLGATQAPANVADAVARYLHLRREAESALSVAVDRRLGKTVLTRLKEHALL